MLLVKFAWDAALSFTIRTLYGGLVQARATWQAKDISRNHDLWDGTIRTNCRSWAFPPSVPFRINALHHQKDAEIPPVAGPFDTSSASRMVTFEPFGCRGNDLVNRRKAGCPAKQIVGAGW
ncbi:MAG: hypothetical protein ACK5TQ_10465 [Acetobacteraceae bacterium]|jgi:hypothetical protein|nr:hypothetical protein [Roseomonas sp.]